MTPTIDPQLTFTPSEYYEEPFTDAERAVLDRFFTTTTGPVFALINLPEVVKGALFSRYSRTTKSIRRLFLDEFYEVPEIGIEAMATTMADTEGVNRRKAEDLYQRVFTDYGDDSVAQLGSVHLACEQASNLLTKALEWGRLAAYLEQSTRYMFYDQPIGGRYRYFIPPEIAASNLADPYVETMDAIFDAYGSLTPAMTKYYETLFPQDPGDSDFVYKSTIRAKVCDDLRAMLPAATLSNVGINASGQAYEMLIMRLLAHPLAEYRHYGSLILTELRKVIPAFLRRVDMPDRGVAWIDFLSATAERMQTLGDAVDLPIGDRPEVTLVEWDPGAEEKIAAAALYAVTDLPDDALRHYVGNLDAASRARIIAAYVGDRGNRRHKPGRAMERVGYRFDVLCDYGIFRDLQRHRLLTLEWQRLGTLHGYIVPPSIPDIGADAVWRDIMERTADLHGRLTAELGAEVAQYVVPFAYRIRFYMDMNVREAFHLLELRTVAGGHPGYRRVAQEMHRLIRDKAGHTALADAMRFVDYEDYGLERLESERRAAARRAAAGIADPENG
jgi:thymidylate synthase ThyX